MMELEFLGVGEAFDPQLGNSSFILKSQTWLMVDCGYGVPRLFFEKNYAPHVIEGIYLTHFHADHFFGLPALLNVWKKEGRSKPLTFIGQSQLEQKIIQLLELGYPGMQAKLPYPLHFVESESSIKFKEYQLQFAETQHSIKNLAVKIHLNGLRIGISGDGGLTFASKQLFEDCHILIHDAFRLKEPFQGHETAESVVAFAHSLPHLKVLAFVHIMRKERLQHRAAFLDLGKGCPFQLIVPEPGDVLSLDATLT